MLKKNKISVIGGAGHVGAPLGLVFSSKGYKVSLIDKNKNNINKINNSIMPYFEEGSSKLLKKMREKKKHFCNR